jgi:hypothetical protein
MWLNKTGRPRHEAISPGKDTARLSMTSRLDLPSLTAVVLLTVVYAVVALAIYAPGLDGPMQYDSEGLIADNEAIFSKGSALAVIGIFPQRPLAMITYYLNYRLGGMEPAYFRLVNVVLLACLASTVAVLIKLVLDGAPEDWEGTRVSKNFTAASLGLLFLVHPLNVFSTMYVWQRMNLLASLFSCASIAVYLAIRWNRFPGKIVGYGLCFALFVLGLLSKETAIVVPALIVLVEVAFMKPSWRSLAARICVIFLIVLPTLWAVSWLQHPHGRPELGSGVLATASRYYSEAGLTFSEVLMTQSRAMFSALATIVAPVPSEVLLFRPLVLSRSLLSPPTTLPAVIGVVGLAGLGLWLLVKLPTLGFGILWFLVSIAPEALLVPQYPYLGYRYLLPMTGLFLCAAAGVVAVLTAVTRSRFSVGLRLGIATLIFFLVCVAATIATSKAALWKDPVSFWEEHVVNIPRSGDIDRFSAAQALNNLAHCQIRYGGSQVDALHHLQRASELNPRSWTIYYNMGRAHRRLENYTEAVRLYRKALEINPMSALVRSALEEAESRSQSRE